jgi:hypothetical protein
LKFRAENGLDVLDPNWAMKQEGRDMSSKFSNDAFINSMESILDAEEA